MKICLVNPISQTSPDRWSVPPVESNRQSITVQMARHLESAGATVTVVMADPFTPDVADEGVECVYLPVRRTPLSPPAQIPWMKGLTELVGAGGFDAVVSSEVFQWSTLALARADDVPPLFVWHEADGFQRLGKTIPARIYYATAGLKIARRVCGYMPRTDSAARFLSSVGVPAEKIGPEIPNGIDSTGFGPRRDSRDRTPLVLYVGSLIERKNPSLAVRGMARVHERFPDACLLMKGFGDQEALLRELISGLSLDQSVTIETKRSDHSEMAALYNRAWVAVFPSFRDFASLSPIEAVACGVPVVLSERLFHARYLEERGCGRATSDDAERFGDAVSDLIAAHGRAGLADAAIAPVVNRFSIESGAHRMLQYLEQTLPACGASR